MEEQDGYVHCLQSLPVACKLWLLSYSCGSAWPAMDGVTIVTAHSRIMVSVIVCRSTV